jgi:hypothetical protein
LLLSARHFDAASIRPWAAMTALRRALRVRPGARGIVFCCFCFKE